MVPTDEVLVSIIIPIASFALIFGMFYLYIITRHRQRLALIEKGADASIFGMGEPKSGKFWTIRIGMFFVGIAIGILMGNIVAMTNLHDVVAYMSMIFLFAGLSLVLFYVFFRKLS